MLRDTVSVCGMVLVLLSGPIGQAAAKTPGPAELMGTWRGTSTCTDRVAAPACNDEQVVYEINANPGKPNTVTTKADKFVDGKRVSMGVLEFTHDAKSGSWTSELDTHRFHALWRLTVDGAILTGTLTLLPSKAVVRKIDLRKGN